MSFRAIVLLALTVSAFQGASTFRFITGYFTDFQKPRIGDAQLYLSGDKITAIRTQYNWIAGNVSITVEDGGVGYDYVTFSYNVSYDGQGQFTTMISTVDTLTEMEDMSVYDAPEDLDFSYGYGARYDSSNTSRSDYVSFSFDKKISNCDGTSTWFNGNGSAEIKGDFPNNYLDLALHIPEGVNGSSYYSCSYPNGVASSRNLGGSSLEPTKDAVGLLQQYHTFQYSTVPIALGITPFDLGYEIVSYEGSVRWYNCSCKWNVTDGGPGFDFITIEYEQPAYTYGVMQYNFVIKAP